MDTVILMRRFTIIMLCAAIFAFTFSAVVVYSGGGMQSRLGARYTCLQANGAFCMIGSMALLRS